MLTSQQRKNAEKDFNRTALSIVASDTSSREFSRNLQDIEKNIKKLKEKS